MKVISLAIPRPLDGLFTYRLPEELEPQIVVGGWVKVPFGRVTTHAFVVEPPKLEAELDPTFDRGKLKNVASVGDGGAIFANEVMALCRWAADYYCAPLGEVLHCAAPPAALGLRSARQEAKELRDDGPLTSVPSHALTDEQRAAFEAIEGLRTRAAPAGSSPKVALLNGVTGSGKTEVYLELARRALAEGRGVLLLVPEIALTTQLHRRFEEALGERVGLWHSAVAHAKRRDEGAAIRSGEIRVVIGARSGVFAPVKNLGLIVIDEEHDSTYKQEDRVRYHARDLSIVRAKLSGALVVLGSATPSLESRERVREGRYLEATLKHRIAPGGQPPIELVDLREEVRVEGLQAPLAQKTLDALRETLASGGQAMIYLNRRGFASFLVCQDCGDVRGCPQCSVSLTIHRKAAQLKCHVCDHKESIPDICDKCQGDHLQAVGAGTESLELELPKLVPEMRALRLDRDVMTSASRLEKTLQQFRSGEANVLLGTQMLVKGHDFAGVTLVIVILADALFRWPDFRAAERAYQVLLQVSGRAGRGDRPGKVLIQTYKTDHPVLNVVRGLTPPEEFLEGERELRQAAQYPPFQRLALLRFEDESKDEALTHAQGIFRLLKPLQDEGKIDLLGPSEAFLERAKGIFRWDLLIKSKDIQGLQRALYRARDAAARGRWALTIDVDPA